MINIKQSTEVSEYARGIFERVNTHRGQALAEYALILAFIFVVCVLSLGVLGLALAGQIDSFTDAFS